MMSINLQLFNVINGLAYKEPVIDSMMIVFSKYVPYLFMAVLVIFYMRGMLKKDKGLRYAVIDTFVVTVICLFLSYIIGALIYVPRPFVNRKVNLLLPHAADASFPSDHAIGTMSIAAGIAKVNRFYGVILIIVSCIVGFSRVYVGHHYPVDVIGGYAVVLCVNYLYSNIVRNRVHNLYGKGEKVVQRYVVALK